MEPAVKLFALLIAARVAILLYELGAFSGSRPGLALWGHRRGDHSADALTDSVCREAA